MRRVTWCAIAVLFALLVVAPVVPAFTGLSVRLAHFLDRDSDGVRLTSAISYDHAQLLKRFSQSGPLVIRVAYESDGGALLSSSPTVALDATESTIVVGSTNVQLLRSSVTVRAIVYASIGSQTKRILVKPVFLADDGDGVQLLTRDEWRARRQQERAEYTGARPTANLEPGDIPGQGLRPTGAEPCGANQTCMSE